MTLTRRTFVHSTAALAGTVTVLPFAARAGGHGDTIKTASGQIEVLPVSHASFSMNTPAGAVVVDPVGDDASAFVQNPALILVTHEHGDHFNVDVLKALKGENTVLVTNPAVAEKMPDDFKPDQVLANGESAEVAGMQIEAIPAYNTTEGREKFHPKGRDNGYVLTVDGARVYVSGDTEDIPEMRALENIDLAFVCMNLPFTMTDEAAASAVAEFKPKVVYPYHYRGRDGGTQDPEAFAKAVGDAAEVKLGNWYG